MNPFYDSSLSSGKKLEQDVFSKLQSIVKANSQNPPPNASGPFANIKSISVEDAIRELIELEKQATRNHS